VDYHDKQAIRKIVNSYIEGLFWVASYYHDGCSSWTWYYPYLYAPLASDLIDLAELNIQFDQGTPFTPLLQLLSVLPPQSGPLLPAPYERVMINPSGILAPYYPRDFVVDANGKKNSWEGIVCIPFIDESTLVGEVCKIDHIHELSSFERQRNIFGSEHVFVPATDDDDDDDADNDEKKTNDQKDHNRPHHRKGMTGETNNDGKWGSALIDDNKYRRNPRSATGPAGSIRHGKSNQWSKSGRQVKSSSMSNNERPKNH
jgi:5'-3' exonuclease